jgi:hypothetical protein
MEFLKTSLGEKIIDFLKKMEINDLKKMKESKLWE